MHGKSLVWLAWMSIACGGEGGNGTPDSGSGLDAAAGETCTSPGGTPIPLKEAKLIIEHNATDEDTGFQGFIDSEGWQKLDVVGAIAINGSTVINSSGAWVVRLTNRRAGSAA